jgi:hypothetical protein
MDELKILYQEIVEGVSPSANRKIFFRHANELDYVEVVRQRHIFFHEYEAKGIPTESERLKISIDSGEWTQDQEDRIISLRYIISDNEKNLGNCIPEQQAGIKLAVQKDKEELMNLLVERQGIMGATCDELSNKDASNYMAFLVSYKDRQCKVRYSNTWAEFDDMDADEIDNLVSSMNQTMNRFVENKIRQISVLSFFLNNFSYCKENVSTFFGKPMVEITNLQTTLLSLGSRNLSILSQAEGHPPELIGETTPNDILTWYDKQYSVIVGKRNSPK